MLTLITGGARSGKSRQALELAADWTERVFIATAQPFDEEMRRRIDRHRRERGAGWKTLEEPLDLAAALAAVPKATQGVVVDCLTLWLSNLLIDAAAKSPARDAADPATYPRIVRFLERLDTELPWSLILVTNEVGQGIVPGDPLSRTFRDLSGRVNQEVARRAQRVLLMVSGLPVAVKPSRDTTHH